MIKEKGLEIKSWEERGLVSSAVAWLVRKQKMVARPAKRKAHKT
jgi:hypothetical protein